MEEDLLWPLTEWTRTDSYFLIALSMKSNIAFVVVSFVSKMIWFSRSNHWNVKYTTPLPSQKFYTYLPAQLIMWVTLLATTNSWSYTIKIKKWDYQGNDCNTYLSCKTVTNEQTVFNLDGTDHVFRIVHLMLHLILLLLLLLHLGKLCLSWSLRPLLLLALPSTLLLLLVHHLLLLFILYWQKEVIKQGFGMEYALKLNPPYIIHKCQANASSREIPILSYEQVKLFSLYSIS